jgi:hypothetical protein
MTREKITAGVQKTPLGYRGYISVWHGDARIYDDYCLIERTSPIDAHSDALRAISEIQQESH